MASGLGGLIGVGRKQKQQALAGLTKAAQLETQTDIANRQLKAQKEAALMNVAGTVGGIAAAEAFLAKKGGEAVATEVAKQGLLMPGAATTAASTTAASTAAAGGTAATTAAGAGGGGALAAAGAAAPYVLLAIAGGYLLKKIFD